MTYALRLTSSAVVGAILSEELSDRGALAKEQFVVFEEDFSCLGVLWMQNALAFLSDESQTYLYAHDAHSLPSSSKFHSYIFKAAEDVQIHTLSMEPTLVSV